MTIGFNNAMAARELSVAETIEEDGEDVWRLLNDKEKIQISITHQKQR